MGVCAGIHVAPDDALALGSVLGRVMSLELDMDDSSQITPMATANTTAAAMAM